MYWTDLIFWMLPVYHDVLQYLTSYTYSIKKKLIDGHRVYSAVKLIFYLDYVLHISPKIEAVVSFFLSFLSLPHEKEPVAIEPL